MRAARIRNGSLLSEDLELGRAAGEGRHDRIGQADFLLRGLDGFDRGAQRPAGPQIEGERHRRELALVNNRQRRGDDPGLGKGAQRHHPPGAGLDVNLVQGVRRELVSAARLPASTRYWLSWVKMVETWRWPKAS